MATNTLISGFSSTWAAPFDGATVVANAETFSAAANMVDLQHNSAAVGVNPNVTRSSGVIFQVSFTLGSLTNATVRVQISDDGGTTWYYLPEYQKTLTASTHDMLITVQPLNGTDTHARLSIASSGTTTGSSCAVKARLAGIYKVTT